MAADHGRRQHAGHQQHHQQLGLDADPRHHRKPELAALARRLGRHIRIRLVDVGSPPLRPVFKGGMGVLSAINCCGRRLSCETWRHRRSEVIEMPASHDPFDLQRFVDAQDPRLRHGPRRTARRTKAQPLDLVRIPAAAGAGPQPDGACTMAISSLDEARAYLRPRRARAAAAGMHAAGRGDRRPLGRRDLRLAGQPEGALVDDAVRPRHRRQRRLSRGAGQVLRRRGGPGHASSWLSAAR